MKIGIFIILVSAIWLGSEITLAFVKHSKSESSTRLDRSSIKYLWIAIYGSIAVGVLLGVKGVGFIPGVYPGISIIGLALIIVGLAVRWIAILTLRQYFTVDVAIQKGHRIIEKGLYKNVRHPSYSGALLAFAGLGLSFSSWVSLAVIFIPILLAFLFRIKVEEEALIAAFGESYKIYISKTNKLVPGVY